MYSLGIFDYVEVESILLRWKIKKQGKENGGSGRGEI